MVDNRVSDDLKNQFEEMGQLKENFREKEKNIRKEVTLEHVYDLRESDRHLQNLLRLASPVIFDNSLCIFLYFV